MREATIKRFDGGVDVIITYNINDFPLYQLDKKVLKCKHKTKGVESYCYTFATFDIETTTICQGVDTPYGFMYHWQACIGGLVVTGRYWTELITLFGRLVNYFNTDEKNHFVIYVHNLAFEYQFMKDFIFKYLDGFKVFARAKRQPISVKTGKGLEFRCSYILSNMSLEKACENEKGVIHCKATGDLDYKVLRTPKTPINNVEFGYNVSDVVCLYEFIEARMNNEFDNLETIPLTSTGYVRRECRRACRKNKHYHDFFLKLAMTPKVYTLLKEESRGGNTHASRFLAGHIWYDLDSFDAVSEYPYVLLTKKFPMSKFEPYGELENLEEFYKLLEEKACLFRLTILNPSVKNNKPFPYIPIAKCLSYSNAKLDNGRVLRADMLKLTCTDIDFKIIQEEYVYEGVIVEDMHISKYDYLPKELRDAILEYFIAKCKLKAEIERYEEEDDEKNAEALANALYLYAKSKNRLNGIFGMCFTDPCKEEIRIDEALNWIIEPLDIEKALERYNKSRNSFLYYAWGCWTTCHARRHFENLTNATTSNGGQCVYGDTDSNKAFNVDYKVIEELNNKIIAECEERGAYCDVEGKRYYLGYFEKENKTPIKRFKTLGAKKYCYEDEKGFHITIAGVNKKKGALEMGSVDNFKAGFIFKDAGGSTLYYNDSAEGIYTININGEEFETASNIGIVDSTYELGITEEYAEILEENIYKYIDELKYV